MPLLSFPILAVVLFSVALGSPAEQPNLPTLFQAVDRVPWNAVSTEQLQQGDQAASALLARPKPESIEPAEWRRIQASAFKAKGWVSMRRSKYAEAEQFFLHSLELRPEDADSSAHLAMLIKAQAHNLPRGSEQYYQRVQLVVYHLARAVSHQGGGELSLEQRRSLSAFLRKYFDLHYASDGSHLAGVLKAAEVNAMPGVQYSLDARRLISTR